MSTTGLSGNSAIVTGVAGGIGRAAALRFAAEGAKVLVADLNTEAAKSVVSEIEAAGGTALAVMGDLSHQAVIDEAVASAVDSFGGVDVLVDNAGIAIAPGGTATNIAAGAGIDREAHDPSVLMRHMVDMGRVAAPEEQAAAIVHLASDAAGGVNGVNGVNGAILPVDDGWSAV